MSDQRIEEFAVEIVAEIGLDTTSPICIEFVEKKLREFMDEILVDTIPVQ